ncbi:MAG: DnaD domain-containing protein [Bacillaceae bacterium]|nr:DnaD domain-containing protein [Bacillaceae bacterium]
MKRSTFVEWFNEGSISIPLRLLKDYKQLGLNENELMLLLHIYSFVEKGNSFPTPGLIAERMTKSEQECSLMLSNLVKRGFLHLQEGEDESHRFIEVYSLRPLWDKCLVHALNNLSEKQEREELQAEINIYQMFEEEFGRPLSPIEYESLTMWLDQDHYDPTLIKQALMEAIVSGKRNLRYIDRILVEWTRNGIKTVEQAREYGKKFRKHQYTNANKSKTLKRPTYDWLEQ